MHHHPSTTGSGPSCSRLPGRAALIMLLALLLLAGAGGAVARGADTVHGYGEAGPEQLEGKGRFMWTAALDDAAGTVAGA
jgi:hypothetical protein